MSNIYDEIYAYTGSIPVINTHSHHREDPFFSNLTLETLFRTSYVDWCGVPIADDSDRKRYFLDTVRYNSYFVWLEKALKEVYGFDVVIENHNWQNISDSIKTANSRSGFHLELLKNIL